jgi:hypothetical protein
MRKLVTSALLLTALSVHAQTISSVFPGSGRPGDFVHIAGKDLLNSAVACAPLGCGARVMIGGVEAAKVSITANEVVVIAPDHAPGAADVTFTSAGFPPSTLAGAFTFEYASSSDYERMLVPVAGTTPGAFGSVWRTSVSAYSDTATLLRVPYCSSTTACGASYALDAKTPSTFAVNAESFGSFLYVQRDLANAVDLVVHVYDSSHPADSNVDVPVVRSREFRPSIRLLNVPLDASVRSLLRVYDYSSFGPITVSARDDAGHTLGSVTLQPQNGSTDFDYPMNPAATAVRVDQIPGAAGHDSVILDISSDLNAPIWAFVSVTNNDTQHINLIVPHQK